MVYLLFRFCLASKSKKGGENGKQFFRQLSEHIKNFKSFIQDKLSKKKKTKQLESSLYNKSMATFELHSSHCPVHNSHSVHHSNSTDGVVIFFTPKAQSCS